MITNDRRVRIISGHYGSGKTEIAVNYAFKLAEEGRNPVLADIDIINPYFRSRERFKALEEKGVKLIGSSIKAPGVDVPAISAEVYSVFDDRSLEAVVDVGGDKAGADVLRRFSDHFSHTEEYDLFVVINSYRPSTRTVPQVEEYIMKIADGSGLKVSGIINNTHMLKSTTARDIITGYEFSMKVSDKTGIPVRYSAGLEKLAGDLPAEIRENFFPMKLYMRDEWMS